MSKAISINYYLRLSLISSKINSPGFRPGLKLLKIRHERSLISMALFEAFLSGFIY
jgi:hypothetical protein